jgi:hypothetical protein
MTIMFPSLYSGDVWGIQGISSISETIPASGLFRIRDL